MRPSPAIFGLAVQQHPDHRGLEVVQPDRTPTPPTVSNAVTNPSKKLSWVSFAYATCTALLERDSRGTNIHSRTSVPAIQALTHRSRPRPPPPRSAGTPTAPAGSAPAPTAAHPPSRSTVPEHRRGSPPAPADRPHVTSAPPATRSPPAVLQDQGGSSTERHATKGRGSPVARPPQGQLYRRVCFTRPTDNGATPARALRRAQRQSQVQGDKVALHRTKVKIKTTGTVTVISRGAATALTTTGERGQQLCYTRAWWPTCRAIRASDRVSPPSRAFGDPPPTATPRPTSTPRPLTET